MDNIQPNQFSNADVNRFPAFSKQAAALTGIVPVQPLLNQGASAVVGDVEQVTTINLQSANSVKIAEARLRELERSAAVNQHYDNMRVYGKANAEMSIVERPSYKPKVKVVVVNKPDKIYSVHGKTAQEAVADARQQLGGHAGETNFTYNRNVKFDYSWKQTKGGFQVIATVKDITLTATTQVTMPKWDGYNSASLEEQKKWDSYITGLRDHEKGHEEIAEQGATQVATSLNAALTSTFTVFSKSKAGATVNIALNTKLNQVLDPVQKSTVKIVQQRSDSYDLKTQSGKIPRSNMDY